MIYEVKPTNKFTKDLKRIKKRGYDVSLLTEIMKVSIRDILYFEGQNNRVCITTIHKKDKFYKRLEEVKQELPAMFFSPHRSYLVNYDNVEKITNHGIHLRGCDIEIPISRRKLQEVREMQMQSERRS